ncbi:MAG: DmsC/YnfH family molybdoenzyme membrane anchor subunit [Dongiaceae bacterium]
MHPALSVIVFTVSSGIGYGMLFWLAFNAWGGWDPAPETVPWAADRALGIAAFGLAFTTIVIGLLSSTLHLGHPERAWRAFSQWRSSWLSREGVLAIATFVPTGLFATGWVMFESVDGWWMFAGIVGAGLCLATVFCTAMIYASLKPVPAWNTQQVPLLYLLFSLGSGGLWLAALGHVFGAPPSLGDEWIPVVLVLAVAIKLLYWHWIDGGRTDGRRFFSRPHFPGVYSAIGVPSVEVRPLDEPHTQQNYLMREMGFVVARRHARKLRAIALGLWVLPVGVSFFLASEGTLVTVAALAGALTMTIGLLIERWLFFAEAKHTVMLYYRDPATR